MKDIKKFYGWTENKLKGNIAETIIEHMLEYSGYKVYRFGYEKTLEKIKDAKLSKSLEKKKITCMPDFIVVDENGNTHFIEVKYRKGGLIGWDEEKIDDLYKTWPDAKLIIVSLNEPHFNIARIKEFKETNKFDNLENNKFIKVNKELIKRYEGLVKKYYK